MQNIFWKRERAKWWHMADWADVPPEKLDRAGTPKINSALKAWCYFRASDLQGSKWWQSPSQT